MGATLARSHRSRARESPGGAALLKVGDLLAGKYRVERILGEGGMGVVVAAHHELLDQHVAVKLLYQDIADREAQSRLLLEARACAKLQSEHVARVIDVDTGADGLPFIVMELLEGADLCQIADARGALPRWLVADYILQALEGLAHAHSRGIVHRDLKPSNLFLANRADGSQVLKILDFGISKSSDPAPDRGGERKRSMQLTGGEAVLGSPPYMSPEQVRSPKTVDARTDIWSLGVVMYELLTNSMPFGGTQMNETFAQILERDPQPLRNIVSTIPEGLERVVMRCLSKNRDHRFADVGELARALVAYGSGAWTQAADRVHATLSRVPEDPSSQPRMTGPSLAIDRSIIPSSPGRRSDASPPDFTGTASTVARRFSVLGTRPRHLLVLSGAISIAALVILAGTALRRSRGPAEPPVTSAVEGPAVATAWSAAPLPEDETPVASEPLDAPPTAASSVQAASSATVAPSARKQPVPLRPPSPVVRRPSGAAPLPLPLGLPRNRDGK